jgi:protocatechuate 3,4-dioxygenase beta subunit
MLNQFLRLCRARHKRKNPRSVAFFHRVRKLAALVTLRGDEKEPVTVRLTPAGTLTGRLLDADGQPVGDAEIYTFYAMPQGANRSGFLLRDLPPRTDKNGRFRLEAIVPGLKATDLHFLKGRQLWVPQIRLEIKALQSGQTLDLGDVRVKPRQP